MKWCISFNFLFTKRHGNIFLVTLTELLTTENTPLLFLGMHVSGQKLQIHRDLTTSMENDLHIPGVKHVWHSGSLGWFSTVQVRHGQEFTAGNNNRHYM